MIQWMASICCKWPSRIDLQQAVPTTHMQSCQLGLAVSEHNDLHKATTVSTEHYSLTAATRSWLPRGLVRLQVYERCVEVGIFLVRYHNLPFTPVWSTV